MQRVFKLAPNYEKAKVLLGHKLHSSQAIYALGKKRFIEKVAGALITEEEAKKIYNKAEKSYAVALAIFGEVKSLEHGSALKVLPDIEKTYNNLKHSTMKDFPDWKTLFTSPDICECEHCRSVYGPASYLTDILNFLDKRGSTTPGVSARKILFDRRPDIGEIDLNCDNSEVAIPYADLVSEILEDALVDTSVIVSNAIEPLLVEGSLNATVVTEFSTHNLEVAVDALVTIGIAGLQWFIRDSLYTYKIDKSGGQLRVKLTHQTHGNTVELKALPEYINYAAYDTILKTVLHPISLPFDLSWEETRAYLDKLGINRVAWMETFRNQTTVTPTDVEIAAEFLELSSSDENIIVSANPAAQSTFWGGLIGLEKVSVFLQRSQLEYPQLLDLLKLTFINPLTDSKILHLDTTCDTEQKTISNLDANKLDRINRFLRLWRKTGWQMWELDAAIMSTALGSGALSAPLLVKLKTFIELRVQLKLSVEELLAYYGDISIEGDQSLYKILFRNKILLNPLPDAFKVEWVTKVPFVAPVPPAPPDRTITLQLKALAAVLKLKEEEAILIQSRSLTDNDLSLTNISTFYRIASLIRKQKISAKEFYLLLDILNTGAAFNVFQSLEKTAEFIEIVELIKFAKSSIYELGYLLLQRDEGAKQLMVAEQKIINFITTGRDELQKVKDDLYSITGLPDEIAKALIGKISSVDEDAANTTTQVFNGTYTGTIIQRDTFLDTFYLPLIATASIKTKLNARDTATLADKPQKTNEAYDELNKLLKDFFQTTTSRQVIYILHADQFKLTEEVSTLILNQVMLQGTAVPLLNHWLDATLLAKDASGNYTTAITPVNFPNLFSSYRLIEKISLLQTKLPFDTSIVELLISHAADFGVLAFNELPLTAPVLNANFDKWKSYVELHQFSSSYPDNENGNLSDVLRKALPLADTEVNFLAALAAYTGWDVNELTGLKTQLGLVFPSDYRIPKTYLALDAGMNLMVTAAIQASQIALIINPSPVANDAMNVKQLVKSKYDNQQWLNTSTNIQNVMRDKKRDALIAYYTHHTVNGNTFHDSNELYNYFLLDVEMGAKEVTTRVLQAYLSVQLFVQRCLMNIEAEVDAVVTNDDDGWLQWPWMKNYRVWEANRKVFLYPENWIEPELRLDKSSFFKEMENDLMQNEINQANVENAYLSYLEKLDNVARLDVCGYYYDHETYTLHVFGRTYDDPHIYYYRTFVEDRYWTPWEKVDLEINATQLIPIVINRRIY
ncbi:MAG: neuraminidase-like domain-containing protein, partial [Sediminibacterium sp.]